MQQNILAAFLFDENFENFENLINFGIYCGK